MVGCQKLRSRVLFISRVDAHQRRVAARAGAGGGIAAESRRADGGEWHWDV